MAGLRTDKKLSGKLGIGTFVFRRRNVIQRATRISSIEIPGEISGQPTIEALENRRYMAAQPTGQSLGQSVGQTIAQTVLFPASAIPSNSSDAAASAGAIAPSAIGASPQLVMTPIVTAISPTMGPLAGGTTVTITGANFTGATTVNFGSVAATSFTLDSASQITAVTPAEAAGTVDTTVTTGSGTSVTSTADQFTFGTAMTTVPTVTAISPTTGPVAGGTAVTITGTNLTGATAVKFGTIAATNVTVVSSTQITATSPAEAAGTVDVKVTTANGTSATSAGDQFTFGTAMTTAPTVTAISPTTGPVAGGTVVTITGTNLTGATAVKFGTVAATNVTVVSSTQITATSPAEAAGAVDVTVTTPNGTSATSASDRFTFGAAMMTVPTVTAISPNIGPVAGGTVVTITGTNLTGATAVKFGTIAATNVTVVSSTQITATSPAEAASTVDVTVTTPNGTSATSASDQFTFGTVSMTAPTVTTISPTSGPITGGTLVTITGTNLTGATAVKFGTVAATNVTVVSSTQITATSPAEAAGLVNVTVTTPNGTSATSATDQFTFGAVTAGNIIQVTTGADETGGVAVTGSLRAAIVAANATPGSTIEFTNLPAATAIVLVANLPPITAANTTIDGTTGPGGRVEIDGNASKPTNATGAGTGFAALDIEATGAVIQGLSIKFCSTAIFLETGSGNAVITNNYIGDVTASGSGANAIGIEITDASSHNTIGGVTAAAANVISGNINTTPSFTGTGILINTGTGGLTTGNIVEGNVIGLTPAGTAVAGNGRGIVLADVEGNTVENNQICGSTYALGASTGTGQGTSTNGGGAGVVTVDLNASDTEFNNTIENNFIGITSAGIAEPNQIGVFLDNGTGTLEGDTFSGNTVSDNTGIGFDVVGTANVISTNTIASNGGTGVVIATTAERNKISQNSISLNGTSSGGDRDLGIDLGNDGVTANSSTSGTTTTGANGLVPYPTLTVAQGANTDTVSASLMANPRTSYTIEFFTNTAATESNTGFGQGLTYLGSKTVTTDATGAAMVNDTFPTSELGVDVTATTTDSAAYEATSNPNAGATSEFAADIAVAGTSTGGTSSITLSVGESVTLYEGHSTLNKTDAFFTTALTGPYTVTADYGDGTGLQAVPYSSSDRLTLIHPYDGHVSHTYVATVTVYTRQAAVKHVFDVTVVDNPPHRLTVKSLSRAAATTSVPFQATARFVDNGAGNGDFYRLSINYGDGTKVVRRTTAKSAFSLAHQYTHPGHYKLLVTVIDDGGAEATFTQTVNVFAPTPDE